MVISTTAIGRPHHLGDKDADAYDSHSDSGVVP